VEVGTEERIAGWFLGLPENVKQRVRNGSMPIELIGHASTTGSADHNRRLSQRRVARVREILVDLAGSQAQIHTRSLGEYEARTPNQIEEVSERRVEMSVSGEETASRTE
jgi:outer membrane protein OmpA-like peptidoglycan-associated protein